MNYLEAIDYIHGTYKFGSKPGLERIGRLMDMLGNPQSGLRFVHVAGTNGKGSTVAFISSILIRAGYKVGIFTSPFILRFNERIKINDTEISNSDVAKLVELMKSKIDIIESENGDNPTEFEILTAMAIRYFADKDCDIVVFETGLGGVVDSTNIINSKESLVSVITTIAMDHMEYLGNTLEEIAHKKAGIIKEGQEVVIYHQPEELSEIFRDYCRKRNAKPCFIEPSQVGLLDGGLEGQTFDFLEYKQLKIKLLGEHQLLNAAVAVRAVEALIRKGYAVSKEQIREGLLMAQWPGRLEVLSKAPLCLVDGAHNEQGAVMLAQNLKKLLPDKKIIFILGVLADKEYDKMLEPVLGISKIFLTITPNSQRALPGEELAEYIRGRGVEARFAGSIRGALEVALAMAEAEDVICALGSLYYIGQVINFFKKESQKKVRKEFMAKRDALPEEERLTRSRVIYEKVVELDWFRKAETVFTFLSMGSEPDTWELIREAWRLGKRVAVPKVMGRGKMEFIPITSFEGLTEGRLGVLEPSEGEGIKADEGTLVITPGIAFDRRKYRIGYGGGFYDRFFCDNNVMAAVGICFSFQMHEKLEVGEFDQPVDLVITD